MRRGIKKMNDSSFLSQQRLPVTLSHIPIPLYIKNKERQFVFCNVAFCSLAGLDDMVDLIGRKADEVTWSDDKELVWSKEIALCFDEVEKTMLANKEGKAIHTYNDKSNAEFGPRWLKGEITIIAGNDAEIWTLSFFHDVTVYELANYNAKMANLRAEATSRELVEHLRESNMLREQAETANRFKTEFLANMSHEIRTPMNAVLGFSSLMLDTDLTEQQIEYVEQIRQSTESLLGVINDILDLSKIEAGKVDIEEAPFNLVSLVEEVVEMLKVRLKYEEVELIMRVDPAIPSQIIGDSGRLRQILINLGGNAIKFTEKGHIYINITLTHKEKDHVDLLFQVEDTGIGMSQKDLSRIFEKFTQIEDQPIRKPGGTGLGLAISQKLLEVMGGEIGVDSILGKGSTFWFTLQCGIGKEEKEKMPDINTKDLRVIVVDNEPLNWQIYKELFERWQIQLDVAETAEEALHKIKNGYKNRTPYHIAIIDYLLPGLDGIELGKHIQKDKRITDVQLILLTSSVKKENIELVQEAGFSAYLTKPFRSVELLDTIALLWLRICNKEEKKDCSFITRHTLHDSRVQQQLQNKNHFDAKILLVEDNHVNQMVAAAMLKKMGCVVDLAGDGLEGIRQAVFRDYDIIFMDCQMPELDGYEATKELRSRENSEKTKHRIIVAMTAHAMHGDREKCLTVGMDDYLSKPLKEDELFDILRKWLPDVKKKYNTAACKSKK